MSVKAAAATTTAVTEDATEAQQPVSKKAKIAQNRKKRLLALNADDQKSYEKKVKKLRKSGKGDFKKKERGVLYVGHLHTEFEEKELKGYFGQFGKIIRMRLSRSKKTGNSRGYAFLEFDDVKDARIAAKTMDKYLMHERLMKCFIIPKEKVHAELWRGANKSFMPFAMHRSLRRKYNTVKKSSEKLNKVMMRRQQKDEKLRAALKEIGIDNFECPTSAHPAVPNDTPKVVVAPTGAKEETVVGPSPPRRNTRRKRQLPDVVEDVDDIKKTKKT